MIHPHEETVKDVFKMIKSLNMAVLEAGGSPNFFERNHNWTLEDVIIHLASNGIRFVYEQPQSQIINERPEIDYRP